MISSIRPIPPYHTSSLKGLRGIPLPFFLLNISRPLGNPEDKQRYREHLREEEILRQWGAKIVRRLLFKAGIPLLTIEECRKSAERIFFKVEIDCSLVFKQVVYSSVKMEIIEKVLLARDSTIETEAVTWIYGPIIGHSYEEEIDENEWLEEAVTGLIRNYVRKGVQDFAAKYRYDNGLKERV